MTYYQLLKSSILDEISRQRDMHQRLQIEVEDLKMQNQISSQTHEADIQVYLSRHFLFNSCFYFLRQSKFIMIIYYMI